MHLPSSNNSDIFPSILAIFDLIANQLKNILKVSLRFMIILMKMDSFEMMVDLLFLGK